MNQKRLHLKNSNTLIYSYKHVSVSLLYNVRDDILTNEGIKLALSQFYVEHQIKFWIFVEQYLKIDG